MQSLVKTAETVKSLNGLAGYLKKQLQAAALCGWTCCLPLVAVLCQCGYWHRFFGKFWYFLGYGWDNTKLRSNLMLTEIVNILKVLRGTSKNFNIRVSYTTLKVAKIPKKSVPVSAFGHYWEQSHHYAHAPTHRLPRSEQTSRFRWSLHSDSRDPQAPPLGLLLMMTTRVLEGDYSSWLGIRVHRNI